MGEKLEPWTEGPCDSCGENIFYTRCYPGTRRKRELCDYCEGNEDASKENASLRVRAEAAEKRLAEVEKQRDAAEAREAELRAERDAARQTREQVRTRLVDAEKVLDDALAVSTRTEARVRRAQLLCEAVLAEEMPSEHGVWFAKARARRAVARQVLSALAGEKGGER